MVGRVSFQGVACAERASKGGREGVRMEQNMCVCTWEDEQSEENEVGVNVDIFRLKNVEMRKDASRASFQHEGEVLQKNILQEVRLTSSA